MQEPFCNANMCVVSFEMSSVHHLLYLESFSVKYHVVDEDPPESCQLFENENDVRGLSV